MKKVTQYIAKDGTSFASEGECLYHEALLDLSIEFSELPYFSQDADLQEYLTDNARALWPILRRLSDNDPNSNPF